jgi:hypothetical protein
MSSRARFFSWAIGIGVFAIAGCSGGGNFTPLSPVVPDPGQNPAAPFQAYNIVTISDLHFNPLYDASLYPQLVGALPASSQNAWDPNSWLNIYKTSTVMIPSMAGTDTNFPLLELALASVHQNMPTTTSGTLNTVVLFTGDMLGHNIEQSYCQDYLKGQGIASPAAAQVGACIVSQRATIQAFITAAFTFVAAQIQAAVGGVPVLYAPGNIDTYDQNLDAGDHPCKPAPAVPNCDVGPDSAFLANTAAPVWNYLLPNDTNPANGLADTADASFSTTYPSGGYYFAELFGKKLRVIVLNSNSFVEGSPTWSGAGAELSWLSQQLQAAQTAGEKVWILMHVPPGVNSQYTAQVAAVPSEVNEDDVSMMWDATLQQSFLSILQQYSGEVTMMLAGHTHMDEFRILSSSGASVGVLEQLPGISPCFGNNPAYKVITVAQRTLTPVDYQSFDYDLGAMPSAFGSLYRFSAVYGANPQNPLASSLQSLYPKLNSNLRDQDDYTLLYSSGSTAVNPITYYPWNPINDVNWPIFGCTIGKTDLTSYVNCVNAH